MGTVLRSAQPGAITMNSLSDLPLLGAYMDDALDETQRLAVKTRLAHDAAWRDQLQSMRLLRAAVQTNARRYAAPHELRARIRASAHRRPGGWWRHIGLGRLAQWGGGAI